ncbi:ArsR/SmtB family transcription factor [Bradyrhizobium guangdongense]
MANQLPQLDQVFAALADPTRRAIVMRLCVGEASVGELADPFDMALPSFMKHIHVLEQSGLVQSEKSGRVRTCRLSPDALLSAEDWFQHQRAIWEARLDRFEAYVMKLKKERAAAKRPSKTADKATNKTSKRKGA